MDYRIFAEWDEQCGISLRELYPLIDGFTDAFKSKTYGAALSAITVVLICRPRDLKQRKRYKKESKAFEYDIILDFFLIKNEQHDDKKYRIRQQLIEITEQTFKKYSIEHFDKAAFLQDFRTITTSIFW